MQEVTLNIPSVNNSAMKEKHFNLSDHFESTKNKFIEKLSSVYGHPNSLIDADLKDGANNVVILTFYIEDNSQKDLLLAKMKDCSLTDQCLLKENMNTKLKAATKLAPHAILRLSNLVYSDNSGEVIMSV